MLIEDEIRYDINETGVLIAADGSVIKRVTGYPQRVPFLETDLMRARGATMTHNHPGSTGFSTDDVEIAAEFGFEEVRVVTALHRYGISQLQQVSFRDIRKAYQFAEQQVSPHVTEAIRVNKVDLDDFESEVRHRAWTVASWNLMFTYWRNPP